jgi:hypothetical protein
MSGYSCKARVGGGPTPVTLPGPEGSPRICPESRGGRQSRRMWNGGILTGQVPAFQIGAVDYLADMLRVRFAILGFLLAIAAGGGLFLGLLMPRLPAPAGTSGQAGQAHLTTASLIQEIQGLSELVTVKYVVEKVVVLEDVRWYGDNRVLLVAHGVVKAGVDLRRVQPEDLVLESDTVHISLPTSTITDVYLDEHRTRVIEHTTGLLRAFDRDLQINARRQAIDELRRSARQNGIHDDAQERARQLVTAFFAQLGLETRFR